MDHDHLSTLLVGRLTRLLDLNSLEEVKSLEECGYVKQNIDLQTNDDFDCTLVYENQVTAAKSANQVTTIFRSLPWKQEEQHSCDLVIPRDKLEAMVQLIDYLKTDVGAEGLFRISGNKKRQLELKNAIQKGQNINFNVQDLSFNTHDIAGILKEFFGELKDPLLTKQLYDCYQQLAGKFKDMDSDLECERKLETLQTLFLLLPPLNRFLLKKLVELLAVVADNENNKMDAYNLGVVFAPNIICTRQVTGSAEFTENMEPFTDLMKFIIENALQVFQIPEDFLQEANEYMKKINSDEKNEDVPMPKTFCQRIDTNEYRKEAQTNTNEAITMLYAQILEMPDGAKKNEFLEKFSQSYPGTPLFIPKAVHNSSEFLSSPRTPIFQLGVTDGYSVGGGSNERLLSSPVRKREDQAAQTGSNIPSSPRAKFKLCLKRVRRTSQDILNPKSSKIPSSGVESVKSFADVQPMKSVESDSRCTKVKNKLQSYKRSALRSLRRSLSSPTLITKPGSSSSEDSCENVAPHESFHDDSIIGHKSTEMLRFNNKNIRTSSNLHNYHERVHRSMDELDSNISKPQKCFENLVCSNIQKLTHNNDNNKDSNIGEKREPLNELNKAPFQGNIEKGLHNSACDDDEENCNNDVTPVIRKSLYPCTRKMAVKDPETPNIRTPIICKRDVLSRGVPLVNKSLTLENMRKIRERKMMGNLGKATWNDTSISGKENIEGKCSHSDEISLNTRTVIHPKNITESTSDKLNTNLDKFCHISLIDSPRSDAKESIIKKVGLCTSVATVPVNSASEVSNINTTADATDINDGHAYLAIGKLYNKMIVTSI